MKKALRTTSGHGRDRTISWTTLVVVVAISASTGLAQNSNDPGILEPCLSETQGVEVRIPHTDQADGDLLQNLVGPVVTTDANQALSLLGAPIIKASSPHDDLDKALADLESDSRDGNVSAMRADASEIVSILQGTTKGRIYDGFAMLNYNRGAYLADQEPDEYKMKTLRDTGLTEIGIDGEIRSIWEVDVNMLWYDDQFDADTFLLRVPVTAHEFDTVRVHYKIYSLEREDFSPTVVLTDDRLAGSVQFPFKGFDSVWVDVASDSVVEMTVSLPPLRLLRGVYTWGWRVHPPRIQFLQPVFEITNAHTGNIELEPQGRSYAERNRNLSLRDIGRAAPEMKMFMIAQATLRGFPAGRIHDWLTLPNQGPKGTWKDWIDLMRNQNQLPPEAWDMLAAEGLSPGDFGPYRFISVYLNNEMYGEGPNGNQIEGWQQGDRFQVKLVNMDRHPHYFRNVDFGPRLHDDISGCCGSGSHSFEIMNFKPFYGAPKVAEVQWRAGWGFRPHFDVIQQQDVFSRAGDRAGLEAVPVDQSRQRQPADRPPGAESRLLG